MTVCPCGQEYDARRSTCLHESAHWVVGFALGLMPDELNADLNGHDRRAGHTHILVHANSLAHIRALVIALMAGREAELGLSGDGAKIERQITDMGDLIDIAAIYTGRFGRRLERPPVLRERARDLVRKHQAEIEMLAGELALRERMTRQEALHALPYKFISAGLTARRRKFPDHSRS
jgi:hypothetical protein